MSKQEPTPGPWNEGRHDMATLVDGVKSKWIYAGGKYVAVASGCDVKDWDTVMANARLISSAPAMDLALRLIAAGKARIERSGSLVEFCFDGLCYCIGDGDWPALIDAIGWDRARKAAEETA